MTSRMERLRLRVREAPGSIRQLRDAGEKEALDVAARRQVAQPYQRVEQGVDLATGDLAGAVEEIILAKEVVGLLDIFGFLAADGDENSNEIGAIALVVKVLDALRLDGQHAPQHILVSAGPCLAHRRA